MVTGKMEFLTDLTFIDADRHYYLLIIKMGKYMEIYLYILKNKI
jgi:hypothetical protein